MCDLLSRKREGGRRLFLRWKGLNSQNVTKVTNTACLKRIKESNVVNRLLKKINRTFVTFRGSWEMQSFAIIPRFSDRNHSVTHTYIQTLFIHEKTKLTACGVVYELKIEQND